MERSGELLLCKYWLEIMTVYLNIVTIPPFRVDILSSSQGIRFGTKAARVEANNKIELGEIFQLSSLLTS